MTRSRALFLVLCLMAVFSAGCRENYLAEKEFWQAERTLNSISRIEGEDALEPAVKAFERVIEKYPSTPKAAESLIVVANIRAKQRRFEEARAYLRQFIQNFSSMKDRAAWARYRIAQLYEGEGRWADAERTYWELAEYHTLHIRGMHAPVYLVSYYKAKNQPKELERSYTRALDHFQSLIKQLGAIQQSATPRNYLALAHMAYGNFDKAAEEWLRITADYPKTPQAPMALLAAAEMYGGQQQYERAFELYARYFKEFPDHHLAPKIKVNLGMLHGSKGDLETARAWYYRALKDLEAKGEKDKSVLSAAADVHLLIANSFIEGDNWTEAEKVLDEVTARFPESSAALQAPLIRARHFEGLGDTEKSHAILDEAIEKYRRIESEKPDSEIARFAQRYRASALTQKKDWQGLLEEVEHYYEEEALPEKKGRWMYLRALITHNRLNDNKSAIDLYRKFLEEYPNHQLAPIAKTTLKNLTNAPAV